jgi:hypothetical protein
MALKERFISIAAAGGLAAGGLALSAPTHVFAGTGLSQACEDNVGGDDLPDNLFVTNPVTLGVQIGSPALAGAGLPGADGSTYVSVCYATTPYGSSAPQALGGFIQAGDSAGNPYIACVPDSNPPSAVSTQPSCSVTGGGTSGATVTVSIPFVVCSGVGSGCVGNPGAAPYTTGAVVGTLAETAPPPGGSGAAFTLSSLCVEVDGIPLTNCLTGLALGGATTSGRLPLNVGTSGTAGPCVPGLCVPVTYVGLSGAQLATLYLPGTGAAIPLFGEPVCAYSNTAPPPPGCTS